MVHFVEPLPSHCPWSSWARPNIKWCEKLSCGYIVTPVNAWSNLFYVFVALLMLSSLSTKQKKTFLMFFPLAAVWVGLSSFLFHATYTLAFQLADFHGMYTYISVPLAISLNRKIGAPTVILWFVISHVAFAMTFVFASLKIPYQLIVVALIVLLVFIESANLKVNNVFPLSFANIPNRSFKE